MPGSLRGRIGKTICGVVPKSLVPPVPADCAMAVSEKLATQGMTARSSNNVRIFLPFSETPQQRCAPQGSRPLIQIKQ